MGVPQLPSQAVFVGVADGLGAISCASLGEEVVDVCLHGRVADDESFSDFSV